MTKLLVELRENPDRRYRSPFAITLRVAAKMKLPGFVGNFGDMLDFQLDPATFPRAGYDGFPLSYYPVAQTVIDLNDAQNTIAIVMIRFQSTASDTTLRVYTCVLQQVLGPEIAKFVVQTELENRKKSLAITPNSIYDQTMITNLEGALQLLDSGKSLIKDPTEEAEPVARPKTAGAF